MADFGRWSSNGGDPSLNEINRVDQFIEALSSNRQAYSTDPEEAELAFLFADWRDAVRETPAPALMTEQDAVTALRAGQPSTRRLGRGHLAVVGSAAAAVLCIGGFGTAVYGAAPGDSLYGVRSMLFGDQRATRDDQVVLAAQTELAQVQQLIEQGQWDQAQDKLVALSTTVQSVEQVEDKHDLIEQWNALTYKVVEQDPAATLPPVGDPMPVLPDSPLTLLPVPAIVETTSPSVPTSPSDTSLPTSPTDTTGPEAMLTPPSDSSLPPSPGVSEPQTGPTDASNAPPTETSAPPSSTPPSSAPPTSTTVPSTTTAPSTTTTTTTATSTATATTTRPPAPAVEAPPPASQAPASQSAVQAPAPAAEQPSKPPTQPAPVTKSAPVTTAPVTTAPVATAPVATATSTVREESAAAGVEDDTPVTTTVVAPGGGE